MKTPNNRLVVTIETEDGNYLATKFIVQPPKNLEHNIDGWLSMAQQVERLVRQHFDVSVQGYGPPEKRETDNAL